MRRLNYSELEYKNLTSQLYIFQQENELFSKDKILNLLKLSEFPSTDLFFKLFIEYKIILRVHKNTYEFKNKSVYWEKIKQIVLNYQQIIKNNNNKYKIKKDPIQEAIKLLKNNGYAIFKEI